MLYTNANWPEDAPALSASPKDLGFSRADLWQFTGLVALDYLQVTSKNMCEEDVKGLTCDDWPATECYSVLKNLGRDYFLYKVNNTIFLYSEIQRQGQEPIQNRKSRLHSKISKRSELRQVQLHCQAQ